MKWMHIQHSKCKGQGNEMIDSVTIFFFHKQKLEYRKLELRNSKSVGVASELCVFPVSIDGEK